jgi:hypothetical protein
MRGQLYGVTIPEGRGGWCLGTYQVSVTLYGLGLGLGGGLKHRDRPFGTTTFKVGR